MLNNIWIQAYKTPPVLEMEVSNNIYSQFVKCSIKRTPVTT